MWDTLSVRTAISRAIINCPVKDAIWLVTAPQSYLYLVSFSLWCQTIVSWFDLLANFVLTFFKQSLTIGPSSKHPAKLFAIYISPNRRVHNLHNWEKVRDKCRFRAHFGVFRWPAHNNALQYISPLTGSTTTCNLCAA